MPFKGPFALVAIPQFGRLRDMVGLYRALDLAHFLFVGGMVWVVSVPRAQAAALRPPGRRLRTRS